MRGISIEAKGDFNNITNFLERTKGLIRISTLDKYGKMGVEALKRATPIESGETANSWYYDIVRKKGYASVIWGNTNVVDGCNIALVIQYGHATRNGTWIEGKDYINPALEPVFDDLQKQCLKEVEWYIN